MSQVRTLQKFSQAAPAPIPNGSGLAALLAAGIGAFAMGFFVILNEAGLFTAPTLYGPAGGVSGRTTFAVITWLIAWAVLHYSWNARHLEPRRVFVLAVVFTLVGILATFPPLWEIF